MRRALCFAMPLLVACPHVDLAQLPQVQAIKEAARVGYGPDAHLHTYQSWSYIYGFGMANATTAARAANRIAADGLPFLGALDSVGARGSFEVSTRPAQDGVTVYQVDLVVHPRKGGPLRLSGKQGQEPAAYHAASAKIAQATGLPVDRVEAGHGAFYGLSVQLTSLDAESTALLRHAFALQTLQEQVQAGHQADWFDPARPPEQTLEDTGLALALIAEDVSRVRAEQATILAFLLLANLHREEGAIEALSEEVQISEEAAQAWLSTHRPPTPQDFGVVWKVPDPAEVRRVVEEQLGVVGAAVQLARGVATGDIPRTLEGVAGLAPKDSKVSAIAGGLAAASRGDVKGTLEAMAQLGGAESRVGQLSGRLSQVAGLSSRLR